MSSIIDLTADEAPTKKQKTTTVDGSIQTPSPAQLIIPKSSTTKPPKKKATKNEAHVLIWVCHHGKGAEYKIY